MDDGQFRAWSPLPVSALGAALFAVAGYYAARARTDARRARMTREAFAFVNRLIRHDLRNDRTVIRGQADLLGSTRGDAADAPGDLAVVAEKAEEALARIETTGGIANTLVGDPDLERVDLAPVVADTVSRVEVGIETGSDTARLTVRDNGSGVPGDVKRRLRDPTASGSGGGLHLARTLIERYGGDLSVADNEPRGSVFTVELPRADPAAS
jgi:signal transduction histidine kinase